MEWGDVFKELKIALEEAKKKNRYTDTTNLVIKILLNTTKGFKYRTQLGKTSESLWHLVEKHPNIVKILIESIRGKVVFFCETSGHRHGEGATGDEYTIPSFKNLDEEDKSLKLKLIMCQIQDGLRD